MQVVNWMDEVSLVTGPCSKNFYSRSYQWRSLAGDRQTATLGPRISLRPSCAWQPRMLVHVISSAKLFLIRISGIPGWPAQLCRTCSWVLRLQSQAALVLRRTGMYLSVQDMAEPGPPFRAALGPQHLRQGAAAARDLFEHLSLGAELLSLRPVTSLCFSSDMGDSTPRMPERTFTELAYRRGRSDRV